MKPHVHPQEKQKQQKQVDTPQGETWKKITTEDETELKTQQKFFRLFFLNFFFVCAQHLLDVKSLRHLSSVTLHDRITKSLLHLHKKKKPPSISAQFQVSAAAALCWAVLRITKLISTGENIFLN